MNKIKSTIEFIGNVYKEKCPKCKNGETFKKNLSIFSVPVMNDSCSSCKYKFEREPGYFIGAMYISYGLALSQGGLAFILAYFFLPPLSVGWTLFLVISTFFLFAKKNYKWSRLLYVYIFPW